MPLLSLSLFFLTIFNYFIKFLKFIFNGRIIALQCCIAFCHTTTWISHKYTNVPSLLEHLPRAALGSASLASRYQHHPLKHKVCGISNFPLSKGSSGILVVYLITLLILSLPKTVFQIFGVFCAFIYWNSVYSALYLGYLKISQRNWSIIDSDKNYVDKARIKKRRALHFKLY